MPEPYETRRHRIAAMALRLLPPGTRKGNRHWLLRGSHDGRRIEISTGTAERAAAGGGPYGRRAISPGVQGYLKPAPP